MTGRADRPRLPAGNGAPAPRVPRAPAPPPRFEEAHHQARLREVPARERSGRHPARGTQAARRRGEHLVPRRPGERGRGTHRLRPSVRAHDVPGLGAHRAQLVLQAPRGRGGLAGQRHHRLRSHQLHGGRAVEPARAGTVARERPDGIPARSARPVDALEPAGRRAQRAAPEHRERALRPGAGGACTRSCSRATIPITRW